MEDLVGLFVGVVGYVLILIVVGTTIWLTYDAHSNRIPVTKKPYCVNNGAAAWCLSSLLLWIVTFPYYLVRRSEVLRERRAAASPIPTVASSGATTSAGVQTERRSLGVEESNLLRRLADYQRLSGIFWIVLGAIQICTLIGAIAGIWNVYAGITRVRSSKRIRECDPAIPQEFEGVIQLVIIGIINLVLGGIIGIVFVAFDFYIRDKVLSNAHLFSGATLIPQSNTTVSPPPISPAPQPAEFDEQLRRLAKLKQDGVISDQDFDAKKKVILGL